MKNIVYNTASIVGSSHIAKNMNNQDSSSVYTDEDYFIGVVTDGCSGGKNSEVGAKLISKYITCRLSLLLRKYENINEVLVKLEKDVLSYITEMVSCFGTIGNQIGSISDFFLFTIKV